MTKEKFYADPKRRKSIELDFGVLWRDEYRGQYRITWIEDTGECYSVTLSLSQPDYQIIGRADTREEIERKLKGWADVCGDVNSYQWAIDALEEN